MIPARGKKEKKKKRAMQTYNQAKTFETTVLSPCLVFIACKEISAYA